MQVSLVMINIYKILKTSKMHLYEDMPLYAQPSHVIFAYVYKYTIKNNENALVSYQTDIDNRASNCVLNTSNHLSHRSYIIVSELTRPIAFIPTSAVFWTSRLSSTAKLAFANFCYCNHIRLLFSMF